MSHLSSASPMQPLSVGNVVSAGLRLYRDHFKSYFRLALKAYLWILIPVYGWAKFYAIAALISRLAFGELVSQPESVNAGNDHVKPNLWQFLVAALLVGLIGIVILLCFIILYGVFWGITFAVSTQIDPTIALLITVLLSLLIFLAFLVVMLWFLGSFFIVELPLAVEDNVDGRATISRSRELTKGQVWRIVAIFIIAFLITLPLQIVTQIVISIIQIVFAFLSEQNSVYSLLFTLLILGLSFLTGAVTLPFWQAIKAVIYYDLRTRREGLGLKLRNRNI